MCAEKKRKKRSRVLELAKPIDTFRTNSHALYPLGVLFFM